MKKKITDIKDYFKKHWKSVLAYSIIAIVVIVSLLVAMHLSGYNLVTWFQRFYAWVILGVCIIALLVISIVFIRIRKK